MNLLSRSIGLSLASLLVLMMVVDPALNIASARRFFGSSQAASSRHHMSKKASEAPQPQVTLQKEWEQTLAGRTHAGAASNGQQVFTVTEAGILQAFDAQQGNALWQANVGEPITESPVASSLLVIVGTTQGTIAAYHARNGQLAWKQAPSQAPLLGQAIEGLTGDKNHVASLYANGYLFVWDRPTGRPLWHTDLKQPCKAPPLFSENILYATTMEGHIAAFHRENGEPLWTHDIDGPLFAQGTVWKNKLLIPSATGALFALQAETGDFLWSYTERQGKPLMGSPGIIQDTLLIGSLASRLGLVNGKQGFRTGEARLNGGTESAILTVGDLALIQTTEGHVVAVNESGQIQAQIELPHHLKAPPVEQPTPTSSSKNSSKPFTRIFTIGQDGSLTALKLTVPSTP